MKTTKKITVEARIPTRGEIAILQKYLKREGWEEGMSVMSDSDALSFGTLYSKGEYGKPYYRSIWLNLVTYDTILNMLGVMVKGEAIRLVKEVLKKNGLDNAVTAEEIRVTTYSYPSIFVTVHDWQPSPLWDDIRRVAKANGFYLR